MLARCLAALLLVVASVAHTPALAQAWPTQPIRIIVGFPPGGVADAIPRYLQEKLKDSLGQPIVVENKPGGAGIIAMEAIAKATDGHTVGVMTLQNLIVPATGASLSYDPRKDLVGLVLFGKTASVLTVNSEMPIKSVQELIAYAKANPGKLAFATSGNATGQHFATESLRLGANIDIVHVPYKGVAPAFTDVLANRVPVMFMTYGSGKQHWESGKVRPLAVSTPKRFSLMPELPTMAEASGIKDFSLIEWYALVAPAGMHKAAMDKIYKAVTEVLTRPEHAQFNTKYGLEYETLTPGETQVFLMGELDRMAVIAKRANIKMD
ncbi:MAG: tripartite tricarboxylate transporter substrate binding protein [Burkholderiales bacterium]